MQSGWRKSHHLHHGGTFAFCEEKLSGEHTNIHESIYISGSPHIGCYGGKCHKVHHLARSGTCHKGSLYSTTNNRQTPTQRAKREYITTTVVDH